jgi:hypothetical protein
MHATLLGYDLRKCGGEYLDGFWLSKRRREYLLRPDVRWPLSVDALVWPSFFDLTSRAEHRSADAIGVAPTTTVQLGVKLWDDRTAMERAFREHADDRTCFVRVAVELWLDHGLTEDPEWNFLEGSLPAADSEVQGWTPVGYDIADRYLLSGLMDCGYGDEQREELSGWSGRLNEFGLFDEHELADEFRRLTDRRVPEHAPFFVYRLLTELARQRLIELRDSDALHSPTITAPAEDIAR